LSSALQVFLSKDLESHGMKEIELMQTGSTVRKTLFEYTFPIEHQEDQNGAVDLIGYGHIYTNVDTIIDRVKYSFILIIINSLIKTAALWLFFLYFVNRFKAKPLDALANVASALNPDKLETLSSSKALDDVVKAKHDDELYLLETNFDQMRIAIKVIKAMIDLAHSLDLKVVGEGVETKALLDLLEGMNCDYAQGFYIARPLPANEMHQFLVVNDTAAV
jgi:hypothetical protein